MQENMTIAMVQRFYDASDRISKVSRQHGGITNEAFTLMHEMQVIYLTLLAPFFSPIEGLDNEINYEGESSGVTSHQFLQEVVQKLRDDSSNLFSFIPALQAYDATVFNRHQIDFNDTNLDFSEKKNCSGSTSHH